MRNLEMVNEGFHAFLHRSAWRWNQLVIIDPDWTSWNLVQALRRIREGSKICATRESPVPD
jgi:hypothetical protein